MSSIIRSSLSLGGRHGEGLGGGGLGLLEGIGVEVQYRGTSTRLTPWGFRLQPRHLEQLLCEVNFSEPHFFISRMGIVGVLLTSCLGFK